MRCFGHWTDVQYKKGIEAARKDERKKAAKRVAKLGCNDQCGCRISIPAALAAIRGDDK